MLSEVSTLRLCLMRLLYLLNFVLLGLDVWPAIIRHVGAWDPVRGVAFSFGRLCRRSRLWDFDIRSRCCLCFSCNWSTSRFG